MLRLVPLLAQARVSTSREPRKASYSSDMLSVVRTHLPSTTPIAGCELSPYILCKKADGTLTTEEVTENNPLDGLYLRNRW